MQERKEEGYPDRTQVVSAVMERAEPSSGFCFPEACSKDSRHVVPAPVPIMSECNSGLEPKFPMWIEVDF